jgi:hypothetical protein
MKHERTPFSLSIGLGQLRNDPERRREHKTKSEGLPGFHQNTGIAINNIFPQFV